MQEQITSNILMIRPVNFKYNEETAHSNKFQKNDENNADVNQSAQNAFDSFADQLKLQGINVLVFQDTSEPFTPDSIFPNNWLSMHYSGKVVLYPMEAPNRRAERRMDILERLKEKFDLNSIVDLTSYENQGKFLEGTGSLVLDRMHRIAYACLSTRTNEEVLNDWTNQMNYSSFVFNAVDKNGNPIYHTNVVMSMGDTFCVICLEAVPNLDERLALRQKIESTGKEIIEISLEQLENFAGNMLLLKNNNNKKFIVMSQKAFNSLTPNQIEHLEELAEILHPELGVIETLGGGSARCMIAEIHLPSI